MNPSKYPRTPHLAWSNPSDDDLFDVPRLAYEEVVVTEKMDGECTSLYQDAIHARSLNWTPHPSRSWISALHGHIKHLIPKDMKIVGENLFAKHSIQYDDLDSYFLVFGVWCGPRVLSWDDTVSICSDLGLCTVPVLYRGSYQEAHLKKIAAHMDHSKSEGYVVRPSSDFPIAEFEHYVAKYVRPNHVQTDEHWMYQPVTYNKMRIK